MEELGCTDSTISKQEGPQEGEQRVCPSQGPIDRQIEPDIVRVRSGVSVNGEKNQQNQKKLIASNLTITCTFYVTWFWD